MVHLVAQGVFLICCLVHCYTDFKEQLLYDEVSLVMLLLGFWEQFSQGCLAVGLEGAAATGLVFGVLLIISRGGLGLGDVKLAVVLGAWLGWQQGLLCLLLALWIGCGIGLLLIILRLKSSHDAIAFGPYMCISGVVMLYYGQDVLAWYASLF